MNHLWQRKAVVAGIAVVGLLVGCTDDLTQPGVISPAQQSAAAIGDHRFPAENVFVQLSAAVPSTAGFYFEDGLLNVVVVEESEAGLAIAAVERLISTGIIQVPEGFAGTAVAEGEYTYRELAKWRTAIFDGVMNRLNVVTSLDLDEVANRVLVGVQSGALEQARPEIYSALDDLGVPAAAVVFREDNWVLDVDMVPTSLRSNADTAVGGVEVFFPEGGSWYGCSLGFAADYYGSPAVVTASHCSPTMFWPDESPLHQGDTLSSRYLGWEYMDPAGSTCGTFDTCRATDAALYLVDGTVPVEVGKIARTQYRRQSSAGSLDWDTSNPYFIVRAESGSLYAGYEVNKMGMRTGWTYGSITGTCVTIDYGSYRVTCTYEATYYSDGGDSGGSVFMWDGGGEAVNLSGVHSGQNTSTGKRSFSRLADIETELGAMTTARGAKLTAPTLSGSVSGSNPVLSWGGISGATKYYIYREIVNAGGSCTAHDHKYIATSTSTSYLDTIVVDAYLGTSAPGPKVSCYAAYRIYASNGSDVSNYSNWVYFSMP